jgi:hypothetical protein
MSRRLGTGRSVPLRPRPELGSHEYENPLNIWVSYSWLPSSGSDGVAVGAEAAQPTA